MRGVGLAVTSAACASLFGLLESFPPVVPGPVLASAEAREVISKGEEEVQPLDGSPQADPDFSLLSLRCDGVRGLTWAPG